jgi:hypothetical protein
MGISIRQGSNLGLGESLRLLFCVFASGGTILELPGKAQDRQSLAGEEAAQSMKEAAQKQAEQYNLHCGPVGYQVGSQLLFGYTDNAFYSQTNRLDDFIINPEVSLSGAIRVSEINTLKLSLGLGYEYYVKNTVLNGDAPLVNPDTELVFNIFAGDSRIQLHEKFSYQETLFINTGASGQDLLFNFNDVGTFSRWDNLVGLNVDWDLDKVILSAGYNHENFVSTTASFDYLSRSSEWFTASAAFLIHDQVKLGLEAQASLHNYDTETTLNNNWRVRGGPFAEVKLPGNLSLHAGGGYDTAQYDSAAAGSDYETYYVYGRVSQETRWFTHSLSAGRESALGANANNLENTYVNYAISTPIVEHVDLGLSASAHFAHEYGGAFNEEYHYYLANFRVGYQFHKYWRTDLSYQYMLKNSDLPFRDYYRNRVTVSVAFSF